MNHPLRLKPPTAILRTKFVTAHLTRNLNVLNLSKLYLDFLDSIDRKPNNLSSRNLKPKIVPAGNNPLSHAVQHAIQVYDLVEIIHSFLGFLRIRIILLRRTSSVKTHAHSRRSQQINTTTTSGITLVKLPSTTDSSGRGRGSRGSGRRSYTRTKS